MVEVRVPNLDCEGCASKLKKALFKLKGTVCIGNSILFSFFAQKNNIVPDKFLVVMNDGHEPNEQLGGKYEMLFGLS